ncbi:MAG: hypothetical protein K9L56_14060 [Clostridiales bacterium]|nr:hypothetical protein [Clostridiales bacterium]
MAESKVPVSMKATLKLEKYPEGTTKEQIKNGEVEPIEVQLSEDEFDVTRKKAEEIFGKDKVSK